MRAIVMRDLHDTVTMHPPAGFSLRILDPVQNPSAVPKKQSAPETASAAVEGAPASPALVATAALPAAGLSSGSKLQSSDGMSRPATRSADDRSQDEDTIAETRSDDEVRRPHLKLCRRRTDIRGRVSAAHSKPSGSCALAAMR